jgi:Asp-tRNA(Asn)/Glu-tRNA(Gln) amidotransferase A subunit family amidase
VVFTRHFCTISKGDMTTKTNKDATEILCELATGQTTVAHIVNASIEQLKRDNSRLNAATEIIACDGYSLNELPDGPLRGLPISVKECYAITGKHITSGSTRMKPIHCTTDAAVVRKLKSAGAVIVARGNTSEFLLGRETNNLIYGTTDNAMVPGLTAGGSSGGDGSMTAAGCVAFGIGTDIGGSCRYPALFNGIVGFKPASGQIDKSGIFPVAGNEYVETMNSPGILCRSVRDARLIYNVIGNKQLQEKNSIAHARILTSTDFKVKIKDESISKALKASTSFFKQAKMDVQDISIPESGDHYKDFVAFITAGFTDNIYKWSVTPGGRQLSFIGELLRRLRGNPTISDELFAMLIPFNIFKPSASKLQQLIKKTEAVRAKYNSLFANDGILILPTAGILAPRHGKFTPQYNKPGVIEIITPVSFCNVYNLSCITIPARKYQKSPEINPPGIQLATAAGNEELLLNVAAQLEGALET